MKTGGARQKARDEPSRLAQKHFSFPFFLLASCFLLLASTACGFHPMYGAHGAASTTPALANVKVGLIKDEAGQELRNGLLDRMPAAVVTPRYSLNVTLTETQAGIAIATDATVTRQQLRTVLHAELLDGQIQKPVWKQDLFAVSGYNVLESQFSTLVGEQDARKRNIDDLAERLVNMLALYFDRP